MLLSAAKWQSVGFTASELLREKNRGRDKITHNPTTQIKVQWLLKL